MNSADLARLDIEATDAHTHLPAIVARIHWAYHHCWRTPTGDGVHVQASGHTDPTGDTVAASDTRRQHIAQALRLVLDACASLRGAQTELDRATGDGTVHGYDGSQAAADQAGNRTACSNCRSHAPTRRGRCSACARWWDRHGTERPAHQWQQRHHGGAA